MKFFILAAGRISQLLAYQKALEESDLEIKGNIDKKFWETLGTLGKTETTPNGTSRDKSRDAVYFTWIYFTRRGQWE